MKNIAMFAKSIIINECFQRSLERHSGDIGGLTPQDDDTKQTTKNKAD